MLRRSIDPINLPSFINILFFPYCQTVVAPASMFTYGWKLFMDKICALHIPILNSWTELSITAQCYQSLYQILILWAKQFSDFWSRRLVPGQCPHGTIQLNISKLKHPISWKQWLRFASYFWRSKETIINTIYDMFRFHFVQSLSKTETLTSTQPDRNDPIFKSGSKTKSSPSVISYARSKFNSKHAFML